MSQNKIASSISRR